MSDQQSRRFGEFIVSQKLGEGGMGSVFLGHQPSLDRVVAIKALAPQLAANAEAFERFQREARVAAALVHPNVIQIYQIGVEEGVPYFAMEYVNGMTLSQIQSRKRLSIDELMGVMLGVSSALSAANKQDMVHRDIKPSNIMINREGHVKVTDFGLAKAEDGTDLTRTGQLMGTPIYMSPELTRGADVDGRSDLYSLGVVMYEMLTGKRPFEGGTAAALVYQHVHEAPRPPREIDPEIPEALEAICLRLMAKEPEDRYPDADELVEALRAFGRGESMASLATTRAQPQPAPQPVAVAPVLDLPEDPLLQRICGISAARPSGYELSIAENQFVDQVRRRMEARSYHLPMLPEATISLLEKLSDEAVEISEIAEVVERDPALTAQILRIINSPFYRGESEISNVNAAVVRLGQRELRGIVLTLSTEAVMLKGKEVAEIAKRLWEHSLGCAMICARIGRIVGGDADRLYVAGLLHDIGKAVVLDMVAETCRAMGDFRPQPFLLTSFFNLHHEQIGAQIATAWGLPEEIIEVVGRHHMPPPGGDYAAVIGRVALANHLCRVPFDPDTVPGLPYFPATGLDALHLGQLSLEMEKLKADIQTRLSG